MSPRDAANQPTTRTLAVFLDEPAQPGSFAADRWRLREAGPDGQLGTADDVLVSGGSVEERPDNFAGLLRFPTDLPPGAYRAELLPGVRDLAGNVRGETHGWSFSLTGVQGPSGPKLATSQNHTLVIEADGSLWGWGGNWAGQLGDGGSGQNALRPIRIGSGTDWMTVASARNTSAAIKTDGSLWTWGDGGRRGNLLGQGADLRQLTSPTRIGADNNWRWVIGGNEHFLAIRNDGSLWGWGENEDGTFGLDIEEGPSVPVRIGSDLDWMAASTAGEEGTIALKRDGSVWFWNGDSRTRTEVPLRIGTDNDWVEVAALYSGIEQEEDEFNHLALKSDGSLWFLDQDFRTAQFSFRRLGTLTDWKAVYPGSGHLLTLDRQGVLWAVGRNDDAQLGDGTLNSHVDFVRVALSGEVTAVATRSDHNVVLTADGIYHTWGGGNASGELGLGFENTPQPTPLQIGTDTNWLSVDFGMAFAIAMKSDGTLWSWGQNFDGQLGVGSQDTHTAPVRVGLESTWAAVSIGNAHVLALRHDGTLWGWGNNGSGRLAIDPVATSRQPVPVQIGSDRNWAQVAAGFEHSFALKTDGTFWAWGGNSAGQLGDGTNIARLTPTLIGTDRDWKAVVPTGIPGNSTFALKRDGSLWAWGQNLADLQFPNADFLGVGDTSSRWTPVRLGTNDSWGGLFARSIYKRVIKTDGTLWTWLGLRGSGPLFRQVDFLAGSSSFNDSDLLSIDSLATRVVQPTNGLSQYLWDLLDPNAGFFESEARSMLADAATSLVDKARLLVQLLATAASQPLLFTPERFADVALSPKTQALLALNPTGDSLVDLNRRLLEDAFPAEVARFDDRFWVTMGIGDNHILGVRQDGSLWGEGSNSSGELGNGRVDTRSATLDLVSADRNWMRVEAGRQVSAGIRRDGTLWTWGDYREGLLGVPSLLQPHAIGNATTWMISNP